MFPPPDTRGHSNASPDRRELISRSMAEPLELKKTLNLPKTDFPMKASLAANASPNSSPPGRTLGLYERILEARQGKPLFVLHDGPPYPTGEIHLGTGLNKILKDMIVKSKTMAGFHSPRTFPAGIATDCPSKPRSKRNSAARDKVSAG